MPRSTCRRGLIPGGSDQLKRYKILKRHQKRVNIANGNTVAPAGDSSNSDHSLEPDPDLEMQKVVAHVRGFANDLYLALREKYPINLIYSPMGFCISATMLKLGCKGVALNELTRALFPEDYSQGDCKDESSSSEMVIGLSALLGSIKEDLDSFTLNHAYKIFMDHHHKARKAFTNQLKVIHPAAEVEEIDFSNEPWTQTSHKINHWAHTVGSKQLGDMLTKRTSDNKMIMVNPMYFIGNWVHPFNPALTREGKFYVSDDKDSVQVPMMESGSLKNLLYSPINKLNCRALVLPYKGDRLGLVIFLPNQKGALPGIEAGLEAICPAHYLHAMHTMRSKLSNATRFKVFIPSFRIDCTLDFQGPMKELGIETIFQPGKADFSGMVHLAPMELSVTQILQKVVFDVNESGTAKELKNFANTTETGPAYEESVQTSTALVGDTVDSEIIEFRVDHPFYFQVIDMNSDLVVLAGACRNPLQGKELGFKEFLEKYDIELPPRIMSDAKQPEPPTQMLRRMNI